MAANALSEGHSVDPPDKDASGNWLPPASGWAGVLEFTESDLRQRYEDLAPKGQVDLVVIGCPQASIEEIRRASAVRSYAEVGQKSPTIGCGCSLAERIQVPAMTGIIELLEAAGVVILQDTCPEVAPYNRRHYNHLLTNSSKQNTT